ncbi:MAG: ATP-binding protein, partial [Myxococcota bacterium]
QLHLDWGEGVPGHVLGDSFRIRQVLINLIGNAGKFTSDGAVRVAVAVGGDELIAFTVKDDGIGIAEDKLDTIFSPYDQARADTTRTYGGTGLGLAICRELVELMGGHIEVTSAPGEGSSFTFHVPLSTCLPDEISAVPSAAPVRVTAELAIAGVTYLVVDDDAINRAMARRYLEKVGVTPDLACGGEEAIAKFKDRDYDVILMDYMMPDMDGVETTQVIRELSGRPDRPRIVALTATTDRDDISRLRSAGANDFVVKPLTLDAVKEIVRSD